MTYDGSSIPLASRNMIMGYGIGVWGNTILILVRNATIKRAPGSVLGRSRHGQQLLILDRSIGHTESLELGSVSGDQRRRRIIFDDHTLLQNQHSIIIDDCIREMKSADEPQRCCTDDSLVLNLEVYRIWDKA